MKSYRPVRKQVFRAKLKATHIEGHFRILRWFFEGLCLSVAARGRQYYQAPLSDMRGSVAVTCPTASGKMSRLNETQRCWYFCYGLHGVRKAFLSGVSRHYWGQKRRLESIDVLFCVFAACTLCPERENW